MIKICGPAGWDFGEPTAAMVKVSSDGRLRENDRRQFVKRAAGSENVFLPYLDLVKFAKDEVPIHAIALGAYEKWGFNRNGDGFLERVLRKYHDTFVKFARQFRNHKNKDPKISFGTIKLSAYNPHMHRVELLIGLNGSEEAARRNGGLLADRELEKLAKGEDLPGSMACFPPGTPVRLEDGSEVAIDQMSLGSRVVTHHGNVGEVDQVMTRHYDGDLVRFRASGLPDDVACTSNHKIWVRPSLKGKSPRCPVCGKQFKSLKAHLRQKHDPQHQSAYRDYPRYAEGWVPAEQLTPGDYVRTPFRVEVAEDGDSLYAELLGFYLSEGNTFYYKKSPGQNGVDFSFSKDEQHLVERLTGTLDLLGYSRWRVYDRKNNVRLVRVTSPELGRRLEADAGRYSHGKRLAARFMTWAPGVQMRLFAAFVDGDGRFHKKHRTLQATTVSRTLAFQLAEICWRNGVPARVSAYTPKRNNKRRSYVVSVQEQFVDQVPCDKTPDGFTFQSTARGVSHSRHQSVGTTRTGTAGKTMSYIENGFVYRRVVRASREAYCGAVHNIAVRGDSSYTVNGVAVSNCRVPNDRCSYCGNVASTREEYCKAATCKAGGCYDNLTKLVKVAGDIHHVGVFNDHPCFFDYSHVFRPADPTAYGGKADWVKAAADGFFGPGGVKAAEDLGLAAPWEVILYQDREADGLYDPRLAAQVKLAHALAIVEQNPGLLPHPETRRAFTAGVQPPVDLDALDAGEDREKTAAALAALADRKIVLPLRDFARLAKRAELADAAAPFAAGAISRMVGDGTLESRLRRNPYAPSEKTASARQRSAAARLVSSHSLEPEAVRDRCLRSAARGQAAPDRKDVFQKWASQDRPAEELARDYACYKIAALQRIAEFDANFALTAGFACCQNQVVRDVA